MPEFSFHHGGVSVPDLDAAIEWYGRVLGYELEKRFYIEAARSHTAMVRKGPLRFELFQVEGAAPLPDALSRSRSVSTAPTLSEPAPISASSTDGARMRSISRLPDPASEAARRPCAVTLSSTAPSARPG